MTMHPALLVLFALWLALAGFVALVWFARCLFIGSGLKRRIVLRADSFDGPPGPAPKVSLIVAAKDEEENIESCVRSLLAQDYPDLEVIAVDDRSTDATGRILRRLAAEAAGRLKVITVTQLRPGWFGKNNAMREGVEASTGDWLCFTDADCVQTSRSSVSMAVREALEHGADFLSITPVLEVRSIWERITQPVCALLLIMWFLPERVNDPEKRTAYANGAFMLLRRKCYHGIGGHERVRAEMNEDLRMARLAKREGWKLRVVENEGLYRTRMYRTVGESWRGWSRIFFGSFRTTRRLYRVTALFLTYSVLPAISVAAAATWFSLGERSAWSATLLAAWLVVIVLQHVALWRLYIVLRVHRLWSLTYPLGAVVCLGMLASALLKAKGLVATKWRGQSYRGHVAVVSESPPDRDDLVVAPLANPVEEGRSHA